MSPEPKVSTFTPAVIASASRASHGTEQQRAAGYAAGWAAGARAAAESAQADRGRLQAEHDQREAARDAATAQAISALGEAINQWHRRALPILDEARRSVYEAGLDLAQAVLQHEITTDPQSARTLLERALDLPIDAEPTVLRLNPEDVPHVNVLIASGGIQVPEGLSIVADARLSRGDAITEHDEGALDGRISTALARAREILLGGQE